MSRLVLIVALAVSSVADARPALSRTEAIALAEQFVANNGYTDLPADLAKLKLELVDGMRRPRQSLAAVAARRHGELERRGWGVLHERRGGKAGWTVAFRYGAKHRADVMAPDFASSPVDRNVGRAVTMDPDGQNPRIEHVDIKLDAVERIKAK